MTQETKRNPGRILVAAGGAVCLLIVVGVVLLAFTVPNLQKNDVSHRENGHSTLVEPVQTLFDGDDDQKLQQQDDMSNTVILEADNNTSSTAILSVNSGSDMTMTAQDQETNGPGQTASDDDTDDDLTLPQCASDLDNSETGYVELHIKGLASNSSSDGSVIVDQEVKEQLEELFRETYNRVSGMCLDPYNRVLHKAEVELADSEDKAADNTGVTVTYWTAHVDCNGCPANEPLFETKDERRHRQRRLSPLLPEHDVFQQSTEFLPLFSSTFSYRMGLLLANNTKVTIPTISYAASKSTAMMDTSRERFVVREANELAIRSYDDYVSAQECGVCAPFAFTTLESIRRCYIIEKVDITDTSSTSVISWVVATQEDTRSDVCQHLMSQDVDLQLLAHCLGNVFSLTCQDLFDDLQRAVNALVDREETTANILADLSPSLLDYVQGIQFTNKPTGIDVAQPATVTSPISAPTVEPTLTRASPTALPRPTVNASNESFSPPNFTPQYTCSGFTANGCSPNIYSISHY